MSTLGASTGGVWTRAQALNAMSEAQIRTELDRGHWQVIRPGIYADAGGLSSTARAWAAVLAAGGPGKAVATGRTAARLFGIPLVDDHDALLGRYDDVHDDVLTSRRCRSQATLHASRSPPTAEQTGLLDGCPVASPQRTIADLAAVLRPDALVCVLDHALGHRLVVPDDLHAVQHSRAWRRGAPALRAAAALADARAESALESLVRLLCLPVAPGLVPQLTVRDHRGDVMGRLDFGDPVLRLGVEADGRANHVGDDRAAADRWRDSRFRRAGWTIERCTWWEVRCRPQQLQARIAARVRELAAAA